MKITTYNSMYSEEVANYKRFAEARRKNTPFTQEMLFVYYQRAKGYIRGCAEEAKPITGAGLCLHMKIIRQDLSRMRSGAYDFRLPQYVDMKGIEEGDIIHDADEYFDDIPMYKDDNGCEVALIPYSDMVKKLDLVLEAEVEQRLYEKSRVGDIFALKAKHGWRDNAAIEAQREIEIATPEEARKALEALDLLPEGSDDWFE